MNFPIEIRIGDLHLSLHLMFEVLAFGIGFRYFTYLRAKSADYMSDDTRVKIIIGAIFGAFLGSRLLSSLEDPYAFLYSIICSFISFKQRPSSADCSVGYGV
jgi:phosphatidylglycerol:prolipoprotein diacylglycerol transferase